jgi:hypothetical protein
MVVRLTLLALCTLLASPARAAVLQVSAEAPLSVARFADALRSYVDGAELEISSGGTADRPDGSKPGGVVIALRRHGAEDDDVELVFVDGEETVLNRLPAAMRIEDLYRAAALKVHALLQRRTAGQPAPEDSVADRTKTHDGPDRIIVDTGVALLVPSAGPVRPGLRLDVGLRLAQRWHVLLGAYLEPQESTRVNDIDVSAWELPVLLQAGFDWHRGAWVGWLDGVGHGALRRVSAQAPDIVSNSGVTISPRAGAATGLGVAIGRGLRLEFQASLLAVLADTRYRVDGQVVWPAARVLGIFELGLAYRGE